MWTIIGTSLDGVVHNQRRYHRGAHAPTARFGSKHGMAERLAQACFTAKNGYPAFKKYTP